MVVSSRLTAKLREDSFATCVTVRRLKDDVGIVTPSRRRRTEARPWSPPFKARPLPPPLEAANTFPRVAADVVRPVIVVVAWRLSADVAAADVMAAVVPRQRRVAPRVCSRVR